MKTIKLWSIFFLSFFAISLISSQDATPDNSYLFSLKRVQEKVFLKTISNPKDRVLYMKALLNKRIKELVAVVNNKQYRAVLKASQRYSTLAGQITDLIVANNLKDLADLTKLQFENHMPIIYKAYVIYPKNIPDNEEWKYILDDHNYLKIYLDKLSKI